MPTLAADPVSGFVSALEEAADDRLAGVYLVGGLALADFSPRQSNIDVVAVFDPAPDDGLVARLRPAEHQLHRAGRDATIWYTGWDELADGPLPERPGQSPLETPLTRALLREEAVVRLGPDWPIVAFDEGVYRAWCRAQLEELAASDHGSMVLRRGVTPLVLQAARLAVGAATGRVVSKTEGGSAALELVPVHFRRILHDAAGYRNGATTSMYWGPFERKYDARELIRRLVRAVAERG